MEVSSVALFSYLLDDLYGLERPEISDLDVSDREASPEALSGISFVPPFSRN